MRLVSVIAAYSIAVVATACQQKSAPSNATPSSASPAGESSSGAARPQQSATPAMARHMQEHLTRAASVRDAVIAGDLAAVKRDAQWLAEHQLSSDFPEAWKPHVSSFQDAAKRVLDAMSVDAAAPAVAEMARSCGACHSALGGPKLQLPPPPADGSGAPSHMARHQWAAARLWDALTIPSEEAWLKGTEIMADAPLASQAVSGQKSVDQKVDALALRVHDLAAKARLHRDTKEWASAYREFLGTCAACHQTLGVVSKKIGSN